MASKRQRLADYLAGRPAGVIFTAAEWEGLRTQLAPISESYLQHLLRESGVPLEPVVEGVRQESLAALERSLAVFGELYRAGVSGAINAVKTAQDHTRFALRSERQTDEQRAMRTEVSLWLDTSMANPEVFPLWVGLRKRARAAAHTDAAARATETTGERSILP